MAKKTEKELEIQRLDKKTPLQMFRDYVMITVASFVYAVSVSMFLDPNSLAPGGITGIAIILNRLFGIETGTWMLLINIPILLIGIWKFGLRFILSTIYCTAIQLLAAYGRSAVSFPCLGRRHLLPRRPDWRYRGDDYLRPPY